MASYYQILGIAPDADLTEVEHAFVRLRQSLASQDFEDDEKGKAQARKCLDAFEKAYETLKDPDKRKNYDQRLSAEDEGGHEGSKKPRLGQLCVASGIITVEQLTEAVEEQLNSGLPLGEVLENLHFLSRAELEGLLLGQDLIDLDDADEDPLAARVIALGLLNEDMVLIAQMETRAQGVSLENALVRRGWISRRLLEVL
ncbi:MAG: DnaJ domain-containing protein [Cyanobacteriota/Melainabacteria group bacterium]